MVLTDDGELAFLKKERRIHRAALAEIRDVVRPSDSNVARRVLEELLKMQRRLDELKVQAPATLMPEEARKANSLAPLEDFL